MVCEESLQGFLCKREGPADIYLERFCKVLLKLDIVQGQRICINGFDLTCIKCLFHEWLLAAVFDAEYCHAELEVLQSLMLFDSRECL